MNNVKSDPRSYLISLLQKSDDLFVQRMLDYAAGLLEVTEQKDWWHELTPEQQALIDLGIEQADNGEFVDESEVRAKVNTLLNR